MATQSITQQTTAFRVDTNQPGNAFQSLNNPQEQPATSVATSLARTSSPHAFSAQLTQLPTYASSALQSVGSLCEPYHVDALDQAVNEALDDALDVMKKFQSKSDTHHTVFQQGRNSLLDLDAPPSQVVNLECYEVDSSLSPFQTFTDLPEMRSDAIDLPEMSSGAIDGFLPPV